MILHLLPNTCTYMRICINVYVHTAPDPVTPAPLSSTSINVRWSPPANSDQLPLTYHVNYTGLGRSTLDTTLTLTGLHPYEEYTISVQAGNKGGLSVPVTGTARTYSDSELLVWTCAVCHHTHLRALFLCMCHTVHLVHTNIYIIILNII